MRRRAINCWGRMVLLAAMLMVAGITFASTYYGIKVGGVPVTSDNWGSVTGNTIQRYDASKPCYVRYYREHKLLTLENVKIVRTGSDNRAIYNESCDGLTVKFYGKNYLASESAAPVRLQASTALWVSEDSVIIKGGSEDGIYITGQSVVDIIGDGPLKVEATSSSAIEGKETSNRAIVNFRGPDVELYGREGSLVDLNVTFNKTYTNMDGEKVKPISKVLLKASGKASEPNVQNCGMLFYGTTDTHILEPWGAYYSNNYIWLGNTAVYGYDILIGNHYKALIDADYFPDSKFREQLDEVFPKHYITDKDIAQCKTLDVTGKGITKLTGIHYFTALEYLYCGMNLGMETLNLMNNKELVEVQCYSNSMRTLTLGSKPKLKTLECRNNYLSSLNLSGFTELQCLNCRDNQLKELDVSACKKLEELYCSNNELEAINLNNNTALQILNVHSNKLKSLSLNNHLQLWKINCSLNQLKTLSLGNVPELTYLESDHNELTSVDCSNLTNLLTLTLEDNQLTSLNVSGCTALREIVCNRNPFTQLSVCNLPSLAELKCYNCPSLKTLNCYNNPSLNDLSVSRESLETLDCHGCNLSSLYIDNAPSLRKLVCYLNRIDVFMNRLVNDLQDRRGKAQGQLVVLFSGGGDRNVCTEEQAAVAMEKNWNLTYENGQPIYGSATKTHPQPLPKGGECNGARGTYNLAGERVGDDYKGIVIRNGKKQLNR